MSITRLALFVGLVLFGLLPADAYSTTCAAPQHTVEAVLQAQEWSDARRSDLDGARVFVTVHSDGRLKVRTVTATGQRTEEYRARR